MSVASVLCLLHVPLHATSNPTRPDPLTFEAAFNLGLLERQKGDTGHALIDFRKAQALSAATHDDRKQAKALLIISGLQIRLFQYGEALRSADAARQLALQAKDHSIAGAAANNRATVYSQVGDNPLALEAARDAVSLLEHSERKDYFALALTNFGDIESESGEAGEAIAAFHRAVGVVQSAGLRDQEAFVQDHLGSTLLEANDLVGAGVALERASALRQKAGDLDHLAVTKQHLARLAYRRGEYEKALKLLTEALGSGGTAFATIPPYWSEQLQGEILLALGRRSQALVSFRHAVKSADYWDLNALPGDSTDTQTVATLHAIYQDYVQLAAELAVEQHNAVLSREALGVLAKSRAASLRSQMLALPGRTLELPPRYFELLHQLQSDQASVTLGMNLKGQQADVARLRKTRLELSDLENKIGMVRENSLSLDEKNPGHTSLRGIQLGLSGNQLLLSFSLGLRKSYLWAVTEKRLNLYELPSRNQIAATAAAFSKAVQNGSSGEEGRILSAELFDKLDAQLAKKPEWLIAADGALLDQVPFAALPATRPCDGTPLTASHTLRFLPSELLLASRRPDAPQHKFVGVADPIYNQADSRRRQGSAPLAFRHIDSAITLGRLVGSDTEIRSAAKLSGMPESLLLTGAKASEQNIRAALQSPPQVLHFALHVVSPAGRKDSAASQAAAAGEAALALSLTKDGVPELLTREAIAGLRVPGSLVILSGCASQQGRNVPSAGVIGLGRAWLLAGAAAVVVSAWPTPDDSGQFFSAFYGHLQAKKSGSGNLAQRAAAALQETQIDMQRSAGYRSSPSFWAAYSIISEE